MNLCRRNTFKAGAAMAGVALIPGRVIGANEKINMAAIGLGQRGGAITASFARNPHVNLVAICDVDLDSDAPVKTSDNPYGWGKENQTPAYNAAKYPKSKRFSDFRVMFDKMGDEIDAVCVGTPDHSHFPITMAAMKLGIAVYTEKPLARTFQENGLLMRAEKKYGVVTQMGNQGHSEGNYFQFKAWKEAGVIKDVTHVDAFMNAGRRWHPWGDVSGFPRGEKKPAGVDWDLWHATTAKRHDFSGKLHYGNWRGWHQFGTGCFGDWGAHILDTVHEFLELGLPEKITAKKLNGRNDFIFPMSSTINFQFPARNGMPAMDIDWYDGKGNEPPLPKELGDRKAISPGKFIYSKDTVFMGGHHGDTLQILPYEKFRELLKSGAISKDYGKHSNHAENFVNAVRGMEKTRSPFSVGGALCQMFSLGCIAQRVGGELDFDAKRYRITNNEFANSLLKDDVRKGWEQYYKI